ncbi:putative bifunctional diguanylate cyclase/phosphodiesterase [Pseudomonas cannabina]|uniref:cyclic-guanylate-specific phosphodiesterase n=4 Tax=Pseudomonas syringae group TaxID=136849 RepID=A0A3M3RDB3_PSECA|nr:MULTISPECIES: EAL domain-containing protein [Pseudomonas syringae group]KPB73227.1 HAMP domain/GGDEF domain/EAL domain-containing protein [Pseudomonas syringae pv. maculicola]MBM0141971.1 EAL domain-containing protein [Pseudomonas cannabina pv. alisalensis]QHE98727.1 EAL domain-containing protein [Pseudomonas syringae pv. maculicola str. ES4326]QQN20943.1 EAL domain-containing protein [Pseudomonas cannabina pv. alisalensis]RMN79611.1 HAMP domain/GGDEF domain/EAL domain-containing protein [P
MKLKISFQARIAGVLIALLLIVVGAVFLAVKFATGDAVRTQAQAQLEVGSRVFERLIDLRGKRLRDGVQLLSADFGFRDAVASADASTIRSVLLNHGKRINASDMFLLGMDGVVIASTVPDVPEGSRFIYDQALRNAKRAGQSVLIIPGGGTPHLLVESTVLAPLPIGRVVMGFAIDSNIAEELRSLSGLEVSFLTVENGEPGNLISTQSPAMHAGLVELMRNSSGGQMRVTEQANQNFLSQTLMLANTGNAGDGQVIALLQSPLDKAFQAFAPLDEKIFWISMAAVLASLIGTLALARSVSLPVRALAIAAKRIGDGDYETPVNMARDDELGMLADAINTMQHGIAVRESQLAHNALHDNLTGLPNRALVMERLGSAIAAERPVALLYLGISNLGAISESAGAEGVEPLLLQVGQRLQGILRAGDTVARLTATEFLLLLDNTTSDGAVGMGDAVQRSLAGLPRIDNLDLALECCVGITVYPEHGGSAHELVSRAAIARKDATFLPGRLQIYEDGRDLAHQRQISLIRDLRKAPQRGELMLHYQPKLDIRQGYVRQAEALLRWTHPQFGNVSPAEFIVLAERTGSIHLLTDWVIEEAFRQLADWRQRGLVLQVSVNISADDLLSGDLAGYVMRLIKQYGVPAEQLVFEITESAVMSEPEKALIVLHRLRDCGISLSIDDFGTGYSSLAHLKRLPVQELKIDQSFVRDLDETSEDAVIVRSTIEMSHNLGLKVVAEGVEYQHSLDLLRRWHCDTAQGYLISRPLPAAAFEAWIAKSQVSPGLMVN